ncbi:MAG TPA: hypothetical protein PLN48_13620 [Lachnospiraceae bacterium]|nr:hypothetical protein [Lachnospiraceae bacterium]
MAEDIFIACTQNAQDLKKQRKRLLLLSNRAIREMNDADLNSLTKLYALLYSAYAEVSLLKLIHTPTAFSDSEISQIQNGRNIEEKWERCVEFAFAKLNLTSNAGEIANKKQTLTRILDEYIIRPSQIRNKIAHGQWVICLNNAGTNINNSATTEIKQLDFVKIDRLFSIYEKFLQCILDLAVSQKTHYRDYYYIITELNKYVDSTKSWSIETKKQKILISLKYQRYKGRKDGLEQ